jgi:hypothetical protein
LPACLPSTSAKALLRWSAGPRRSRDKVFQAPPIEWICERLEQIQEILERNTDRSGLVLRELLGDVRLEPTQGDIRRLYYVARTSLADLAKDLSSCWPPASAFEARLVFSPHASCTEIISRRFGGRAGRTLLPPAQRQFWKESAGRHIVANE